MIQAVWRRARRAPSDPPAGPRILAAGPGSPMQQLSEHDAAFLASDSAHANANVSLLHIYDQSTVPGGRLRFKTLLAHIESRMGASPLFRRKLMRLPLDLDRPYWVEDEQFDLEYHVRHIALPKPGDWRQFCIQVSRIHARPLDLTRPLWEMYVIEGLDSFVDLPPGSFALLTKTHHAALDFENDAELVTLLHDTRAEAVAAPPPAPWFAESAPAMLPLLARGAARVLRAPRRLVAPLARRALRSAPEHLALAGRRLLQDAGFEPTRFNSVVSPHRVFETRRFAAEEVERIRAAVPGATVDDVILAVCGGALRAYLDGHGELPAASLRALLTAPDGQADGADLLRGLAAMQRGLGTDIEDPLQRLREVQRQGRRHAGSRGGEPGGPQRARTDGTAPVEAAATTGPAEPGRRPTAAGLVHAAKAMARAALGESVPLAHCSITHVPGPEQPMYLCGARLTYFSAMLPIADGMGLALAVTSVEGRLIISPTSCRELLPDPERLAQCLRDSFQALLAAAEPAAPAKRSRAARARPARPRASASGRPARPSPRA